MCIVRRKKDISLLIFTDLVLTFGLGSEIRISLMLWMDKVETRNTEREKDGDERNSRANLMLLR